MESFQRMCFCQKIPGVIICCAADEIGILHVGVDVLLRSSCVPIEDFHYLVE